MSLGVAIETDEAQALQGDVDRSLLIVDDDTRFAERLARALERRGFEPVTAYSVKDGKEAASINPPAFAVVDLRLEDGNGLDVVTALTEARSNSRVVVLTGYGNIATAVSAVKLGATTRSSPQTPISSKLRCCPAMPAATAARVSDDRRPHPVGTHQRIYEQCDRNVSETARRLRMPPDSGPTSTHPGLDKVQNSCERCRAKPGTLRDHMRRPYSWPGFSG